MAGVAPIVVHIIGDTSELSGSLASAAAQLGTFGSAMTAMGAGLTALVTVPIVGIAAAALVSANNVQKAYAIIIAGTGATGSKLQGLESQFDNLASTVPNSFTDTATVLTTVNNKLSQGGYNITQISQDILNVSRMTGESASSLASDFTASIQQWGISASATEGFMSEVYNTAQAARVPVTSILTDLNTYGPVIQASGLSLQQVIPIIGEIESKGEDVTKTFQGIAYGWANVSKAMATGNGAVFDDVTASAKAAGIQLTSTGSDMEAVFYGIKSGMISDGDESSIFGARFAANITQIIKEGGMTAQQFIDLSQGLGINLAQTGQASITFAQSLDIMKNALEIALNPLGEQLIAAFTQLFPLIKTGIGLIGDITGAFGALPMPVADVVFVIAAFAAALGPAIIIAGTFINSLEGIAKGLSAIGNLAAGGLNLASGILSTGTASTTAASAAGAAAASAAETGADDDLTAAAAAAATAVEGLGIANAEAATAAAGASAAVIAEASGIEGLTPAAVAGAVGLDGLTLGAASFADTAPEAAAGATLLSAGEDEVAASAAVADAVVSGGLIATLLSFGTTLLAIAVLAAPVVVVLGALAAGFAIAWETSATLRDTLGEVGAAFGTFGKEMEDGLSLIMSGNYKAGFADFQQAFTDLWSQLVTIDWTDIGTQIDTEIQQGVADHKSDILNAFSGFEADAIKFFQGVDWTSVGTVVGQGIGSAIAIGLTGATTGLSAALNATNPTEAGKSTAQQSAEVTGTGPNYAPDQETGLTNLESVGEKAADSFTTGFETGLTTSLGKVPWGDLIWGAMTTNLAGGGGTGSHMKIDLNPEDWFTISPLGLSEDDALNKLGMPWLGTTYWVNYDWGGLGNAIKVGIETAFGIALGGLMQTLQPYLSPLDVIKTDIMDIVDIPSHAISLVLDIGGTAWDIVMDVWNFLQFVIAHFSTHDITLNISIPGYALAEKLFGDLEYIVAHSSIVTTLKTEADDLISAWDKIGIHTGIGPFEIPQVGVDIPKWDVGSVGVDIPKWDVGAVGINVPQFQVPSVGLAVPQETIPAINITLPSVDINNPLTGAKLYTLGGESLNAGPWTFGGQSFSAGPWGLGGQNWSAGPWGLGGQSWSAGPWDLGGQSWSAGPWDIKRVGIDWDAPQIPELGAGALVSPKSGGVPVILAEEGKPEVVVPWDLVGAPWDYVLENIPRLAGGGIVGPTRTMPDFSSAIANNIADALKNMRGSPTYQISIVTDSESIKRDVMGAVQQLEQYHHLVG